MQMFMKGSQLCFFLCFWLCFKPTHADHPLFRIGGGIGVGYLNSEAKLKNDFRTISGSLSDLKQTQKSFQIAPSLEIGMTCFDHYYLGIFASWNHIGAKTTSRIPLTGNYYLTHQFKMNSCMNILSKIGYKLTPKTMIYTLAGPSFLKWSHTTNQFYTPRASLRLVDTFKMSKTSVGLSLGMGIEYFLGEQVALNVDYSHNFYGSKARSKTMSIEEFRPFPRPNVIRSGLVSKKVRPSYDSLALRLVYFF